MCLNTVSAPPPPQKVIADDGLKAESLKPNVWWPVATTDCSSAQHSVQRSAQCSRPRLCDLLTPHPAPSNSPQDRTGVVSPSLLSLGSCLHPPTSAIQFPAMPYFSTCRLASQPECPTLVQLRLAGSPTASNGQQRIWCPHASG